MEQQQLLRSLIDKSTTYVNELNKNLMNVYNLRYKFLIHGLVKKGLVKVTDLADIAGIQRAEIYKIVGDVDSLLKQEERT